MLSPPIPHFAAECMEDLKIPNSRKIQEIHRSLIEASELMISATNALEDNAWLGGSVSFAERNLEVARFNFQKAYFRSDIRVTY